MPFSFSSLPLKDGFYICKRLVKNKEKMTEISVACKVLNIYSLSPYRSLQTPDLYIQILFAG